MRVLQALPTLLADQPWQAISLSDVAAAAGVSRQTVYNEFGARSSLAELYLESLLDRVTHEHVPAGEQLDGTDVATLLDQILTSWFASAATDPMLRDGGAGLIRGIVSDERVLVEKASRYLARRYGVLAPHVPEERALALARLVVRLCVSYLLVPPATGKDPVPDLVALLNPYIEQLLDG